jgi:hypothetical protein|tara:strand:- start:3993 stop:4319 length:327 start_codon:yes stop_codon:yes gene_type:complete
MKIIITLLLVFTIFSDFTSAALHEETSSTCSSLISCADIDLHSSSDTQNHDSEGEHDHCHLGHSHSALINPLYKRSISQFKKYNVSYPAYYVGKTQNFSLDVIRPPIA